MSEIARQYEFVGGPVDGHVETHDICCPPTPIIRNGWWYTVGAEQYHVVEPVPFAPPTRASGR